MGAVPPGTVVVALAPVVPIPAVLGSPESSELAAKCPNYEASLLVTAEHII